MNYQSLLKEYSPLEYGDFFRLYRINSRGYVIYCNENNVVSCMELCGFLNFLWKCLRNCFMPMLVRR